MFKLYKKLYVKYIKVRLFEYDDISKFKMYKIFLVMVVRWYLIDLFRIDVKGLSKYDKVIVRDLI